MGFRKSVRIERQAGTHGMFLESPYNKGFVEAMKRVVPQDERKWDGARKQWWISDLYLDEVDNIIFHHFEKSATGRDI